jgi:multiple sugar transport system substrate-binding protein
VKKSRVALAASITLALAFAAAGCSSNTSSTPSASSPTTVTFLTHWGPEQVKALENSAASFTKSNPTIKVKVQAVPFGNLLSTLRTQGASPDGPTIAGIYDLWLPELARDGLADKAPADVASTVKSEWPAALVDAASAKGAVYGIPNEVDLYQLNYNKQLFAEAGISAPPTTWPELLTDAKKLTKTENGQISQQGIGFITGWGSGAVHPFLSLLASNGGSFLNKAGSASALSSKSAQETAAFYQSLVDAKVTDPSKSTANASTTGPYMDNFTNGKTGMIIMANWWESSLKTAMGDKFSNVATAAIPVGPSGNKSSSISYSWMTMVNAKASTAKKAAAWKFLNWLNGTTSGKNGSSEMSELLLSMGILPSRNSDVKANATTLDTPFLKSYVDALGDATPFPDVIGGQAASDSLQKQIEGLLNGTVNASQAMKNATADVNTALKSAQ